MNETRKQIIELIEPFMEKTLSEGCLFNVSGKILYPFKIEKEVRQIGRNKFEDIYFYFFRTKNYPELVLTDIENRSVGHYDITAVLKYIDKYNFGSIRITECEIVTSIENTNACIPNKPLSLYSPKEEIELLELLLKLKD